MRVKNKLMYVSICIMFLFAIAIPINAEDITSDVDSTISAGTSISENNSNDVQSNESTSDRCDYEESTNENNKEAESSEPSGDGALNGESPEDVSDGTDGITNGTNDEVDEGMLENENSENNNDTVENIESNNEGINDNNIEDSENNTEEDAEFNDSVAEDSTSNEESENVTENNNGIKNPESDNINTENNPSKKEKDGIENNIGAMGDINEEDGVKNDLATVQDEPIVTVKNPSLFSFTQQGVVEAAINTNTPVYFMLSSVENITENIELELYIRNGLVAKVSDGKILYAEKFLVDENCIVKIHLSGEGELMNSCLHFSSDFEELLNTNKEEKLPTSSSYLPNELKNPSSITENTEDKIIHDTEINDEVVEDVPDDENPIDEITKAEISSESENILETHYANEEILSSVLS